MIKGERIVAMRAAIEQQPIPVFLITVGKSSVVTAYTIQNAAVHPNFPNISRNTATPGKSKEMKNKTTLIKENTEKVRLGALQLLKVEIIV